MAAACSALCHWPAQAASQAHAHALLPVQLLLPAAICRGSLPGFGGRPQLLKLRPKAERTPCRDRKQEGDDHSMLAHAQREGSTRNATPQPHPVLPAQLLLPAAGTQSPEPLCLCLLLIMRCKSGAACNQRQ